MSHAILGASSSERWINCPGSIALIDSLPDGVQEKSSRPAAEGTAAHYLLEWCVRSDKTPEQFPMKEIAVKDWPREKFPVDDEMRSAVQVALDLVEGLRERLGPLQTMVEQTIKPLPERDDSWGTADLILLQSFGSLHVIDYKHGKGHVVDVDSNTQLAMYGLGVMNLIRSQGYDDFDDVVLWVVQPRSQEPRTDPPPEPRDELDALIQELSEPHGVRAWRTSADELDSFADTLRAAMDRTYQPDAPTIPGDHCGFCPAKTACPSLRDQVLSLFKQPAFSANVELPPPTHDPEELARLLAIVPRWDEYVRALEGLAFRLAERGVSIPGYKLVRKRANRKWRASDAKTIEALSAEVPALRPEHVLSEPKLLSPNQVEKMLTKLKVKKKDRDALLSPNGSLVEKPEGGLTLAPASDPRPAVPASNVVDAFPEIGDTSTSG